MTNDHYMEIRRRIEAELESADKGNDQLKLAASQYVRGLIDATIIVDLSTGRCLQKIFEQYNNSWITR